MHKEKRGLGLFAASAGIAAVVTAGYEPVEVLLGWCGAAILRVLFAKTGCKEQGKRGAIITIVASIPIAAGLIWAAEQAFPQESTFPFVSLCVLMLLYRSMIGEKDNPRITENILGMGILPLVAVIGLFGVNDLDWTQMVPNKISGMQILIVACTAAPWWVVGKSDKEWGWFAVSGGTSLIMSMLTAGILGKGLRSHTGAPLYRAVQGIEIMGKLQRFEALLAAAILMGMCAFLMLIGEKLREATERICSDKSTKGWYIGILVLVFAIELVLRMEKTSLLAEIYWGVVLLYGVWIAFSKKVEISGNNA